MRLTSGELSASSSPHPATTRRRRRRRRPPPPSPSLSSTSQQEDNNSLSTSNSQHHTNHHHHHHHNQHNSFDTDIEEDDNIASFSNLSVTTAASYINVAPLPMFHGSEEECAVTHLSRFQRVCRANNATTLDMMTRIFPVTLDGEASLWYELNIEPNPFISWDEIKSSFLEAYRPAESFDEFRAELMEIRQGEKESVNGYGLRMQWMVKKWPEHEMPEKVLKGIFVDGLREEFRELVAMRGPETVEEAVRFGVVVERARRGRKSEGEMRMKCGFCDGLHEERSCEVKRRMRVLWLRSRPEGRMITPAGSMVRREEEEEEMERGVSLRRGECKCWKHQCWKRSDSVVTDANCNVNDVVN